MHRYGNQSSRELILNILSRYQSASQPLFLIVSGKDGLGKKSFLLSLFEEMLGGFAYQDLLWIRDCSVDLGKYHTIPVETPSSQKIIPLSSGESYENRGIREITNWLQQSSFGGKKILLIENLERMSNAAMNAFLKSCEEPLNNRFIFATLSDESAVLPTIFSRALLVRFVPLLDDEMDKFLGEYYPNVEPSLLQVIKKISFGCPGVAVSLMQSVNENGELGIFLESILRDFDRFSPYQKLNYLKQAHDFSILDQILDFLILEALHHGNQRSLQSWISVKKMKNQNINLENLLRYGLLS